MERILSVLVFVAGSCFCGDPPISRDPTLGQGGSGNDPQFIARAHSEGKIDKDGEPLPAGALARLGGSGWRHGSRIVRSALSADGKRLATASTSSVAVWDVVTGKVLFRFPTLSAKDRAEGFAHYYGPKILALSPDGKKLGIAFNDEFTGVWDLENGGKFRRFTEEGISDSHGHCQFTRDGKQFILVYEDCIRFWHPATGKLHRRMPACLAVSDISADVQMYAQIDHDRNDEFNVRDFRSGATIKKFDIQAGKGDVVFAPDSETLAVIDEMKKEIQICDVRSTKARGTLSLPKFAGHSPDG